MRFKPGGFVSFAASRQSVVGCRRQIVEVQSHEYDKHPDSDAHFSNGETLLLTHVHLLAAETQLGPALTAQRTFWSMHFRSCQRPSVQYGSYASMQWT